MHHWGKNVPNSTPSPVQICWCLTYTMYTVAFFGRQIPQQAACGACRDGLAPSQGPGRCQVHGTNGTSGTVAWQAAANMAKPAALLHPLAFCRRWTWWTLRTPGGNINIPSEITLLGGLGAAIVETCMHSSSYLGETIRPVVFFYLSLLFYFKMFVHVPCDHSDCIITWFVVTCISICLPCLLHQHYQ